MAPARRVSYVIPAPTTPVPRLTLPALGTARNGKIGPILQQASDRLSSEDGRHSHPRHRLAISAFALDTSTQLVGRESPEGILYTGGRDGMVMAWDLGIPMKRRSQRYGTPLDSRYRSGRWEALTSWDDDAIFEEEDDDWPTSDGDIIGDVKESGRIRGYRSRRNEIPYEQQWEPDLTRLEFENKRPSRFRQCIQAHSDWVNDLLLCNYNQTVVSASSDGTIRAWSPHGTSTSYLSTIGTHSDYVRCLASSREKGWVASGSFDRTIKLWDMTQPRSEPLVSLQPPDSPGPKSSVYAIAADPFGRVVASGGPERVVRTWDPRSGKRIGKLVGHTDNIRAILISEDSRYVLTGSADASIKLWSIVSPQRCLHTFTHHTESVWSLFSEHPSLEVFYSGDRSGLVCRVDVEESDKIDNGECVVLCRDTGDSTTATSEGVSKIASLDDTFIWTASGSSSLKRWRVPSRRAARSAFDSDYPDSPTAYVPSTLRRSNSTGRGDNPRSGLPSPTAESFSPRRNTRVSTAPSITHSFISSTSSLPHYPDNEQTMFGLPYDSLVKLSFPHGHYGYSSSRVRDAEVVTMYSAASVMSVPRHVRSPSSGTFPNLQATGSSAHRDSLLPPETTITNYNARANYEDRDVAPDARPLSNTPDEVIAGARGLVRVMIMNDRMHALTVDTAGEVAVWDLVRGRCLGMFTREDVLSAAISGSASGDSTPGDVERASPRQALETVRERIEGEAVVQPWALADTKIGELTVQFMDRCLESEIFADEAGYGPERVYNDEARLNLGKWVLRNLFLNFIKEEQRSMSRQSYERNQSSSRPPVSHPRSVSENSGIIRPSVSVTSSNMSPALLPDLPSNPRFASVRTQGLSPIPQSPDHVIDQDTAITPRPQFQSPTFPTSIPESKVVNILSTPLVGATPTANTLSSNNASGTSNGDYFSIRRRGSVAGQTTPDDFSGWTGPASAKSVETPGLVTPSTPGGGLMGRLKSFGKSSRRAASEAETPSATPFPQTQETNEVEGKETPLSTSPPKTFAQKLKSQPLTPPPSSEVPTVQIPSNVAIILSEETPSGWTPVYRGTVGNTGADAPILEETMPPWLLEYLLTNRAPPVPIVKVGFILLPWPVPPALRTEWGPQLPELLNTTQSKLSASRFLRVRKLTYHVQEKLDRISRAATPTVGGAPTSTPRTSSEVSRPNTTNSPSPTHPPSPRPSSPRPNSPFSAKVVATPDGPRVGSQTFQFTSDPPESHQHQHQQQRSQFNYHQSSPNLQTSHTNSPNSNPQIPPQIPTQIPTPIPIPKQHQHQHQHPHTRAEELYEILCNDQVLPLDMTLAAVRQFVWRQSGELVMYYRRRRFGSGSGAAMGV